MVIWQGTDNFSFGADLKQFSELFKAGDQTAIINLVQRFQDTVMSLRSANLPVVAAVQGLCLGGGTEVVMHCDSVVAAFESYIGLVEVGVGLLPAGGGCKEFAKRAQSEAEINNAFQAIAMAKVSTSAEEAKQLGYLRAEDHIVMNKHELLYVAKQQALWQARQGYRPPLQKPSKAFGKNVKANMQMLAANMRAGNFISEHDYQLAVAIATVLTGGDLDPGTIIDDAWLLRLERQTFADFATQPLTQDRIAHMLKTGKPLRN